MCFNPITIRNPKLIKTHIFDRAKIEVPCGHCAECKDTRRLSWFVRLYYEYLYCQKNNGFVLYETLTYNEDNVPKLFDTLDFSCLSKYNVRYFDGIRCFSVRDIQLYLKQVRKHFHSKYKNIDLKGKIKYFCSMEYGDETHRPHYHILFFVHCNIIPCFEFKKIVESYWHRKGYTKEGKFNHGFVNSIGALSYVSKYVCKSLNEEKWFRVLEKKLLELGFTREDYKNCFPKNLQSTGLGSYALEFDELNDLDNFFKGDIFLRDNDFGVRSYKLPLYYERKLFYSVKYRFFDIFTSDYVVVDNYTSVPSGVDYSPIYVLNDLGLEMKNKRLQKAIDSCTNVYRICTSYPESSYHLQKLNDKFQTNYTSLLAFQSQIKKLLTEEIFVFYSLVYRGCRSEYRSQTFVDFSDLKRDYNLIHSVEIGKQMSDDDIKRFSHCVNYINKIPFIEEYYTMIRYMFSILNLDKEKKAISKDISYSHQKTIYLRSMENV